MGDRIAGNFSGGDYRLCGGRSGIFRRAARWKRDWTNVWSARIRLHDLRGAAGSAKARADVEAGARARVDARAFVAWTVKSANDFVTRGISLWRDVDARSDVAADSNSGKRTLRSSAATLHSARHDVGREAGNDLRRNRKRAEVADR